MHQASHSLLKDVTEAMDDTCTSLSLAALLGTKCHLLEAGQVAQLDSVRGGKNCIIKAASAKGTKQKWCCQIQQNQQKGSGLSNPHPGHSPRPLSAPAAGMHSEDILIQLVPVVLNSRV